MCTHTFAEDNDVDNVAIPQESEVSDTITVRNYVTDVTSNYSYSVPPPKKPEGYYHIYKAGRFIKMDMVLLLSSIPFSTISSCLLSYGYTTNNKKAKVFGYLFGAGVPACLISSVVFHFKSGKELRVGAGCIEYTY